VTIKIILLDDHLLFAEAIKFLLESRIPDLHVEAFRSLPAALEDVAFGLPIELALINPPLGSHDRDRIDGCSPRQPPHTAHRHTRRSR
jgi:two-component system nitrate/nitrite response regulator NarL